MIDLVNTKLALTYLKVIYPESFANWFSSTWMNSYKNSQNWFCSLCANGQVLHP